MKPTNTLRTVMLIIMVFALSGIYSCNCNSSSSKTQQTDTMRVDTSQVDTSKGGQPVPPKP